jgi:hypothetical protein
MPSKRDITKGFIGVFIPLELRAKVAREATNRGMTISQFVAFVLQSEVDRCRTSLTEDDINWIKEELDKNARNRG